jgi:hypothetical protein
MRTQKEKIRLLIFIWILVAFMLPMIAIGIISPVIDHYEHEGKMDATIGYAIYGFVWVPLHFFVWFMILPGHLFIKKMHSRKLFSKIKIFSYICGAIYFIMVIGTWVFLIVRDMQRGMI